MHLDQIAAMAQRHMREHGLIEAGWRFQFDQARRRAGVCKPGLKVIGLSAVILPTWPEHEVRDTILHEIAHALVGGNHGHDAVWQAKAVEIGCDGQRCYDESLPTPHAPWVGSCPAGHTATRYRTPRGVMSCSKCARGFNVAHLIVWTKDGRPARLEDHSRTYQASYRALASRHGLPMLGQPARPAPEPSPSEDEAIRPVRVFLPAPAAARADHAERQRFAATEDPLF